MARGRAPQLLELEREGAASVEPDSLSFVALGLAAAPFGLAVAYVGVWLLGQAVPPDQVPSYLHWEISGRGIAYTIILSALTGVGVTGWLKSLLTGAGAIANAAGNRGKSELR